MDATTTRDRDSPVPLNPLEELGVERFVVFGKSLPPETPPLGDWQLARVLASRIDVVYVAPPRRSTMADRSGSVRLPDASFVDGMTVLQPVAPRGSDRPGVAAVGDAALSAQLRHHLGPSAARDTVLMISDVRRGPLSRVPRRLGVYWRRDRFGHHRGTDHVRHLGRRDRALMERSDLVLGVSELLADEAATFGARASHVPNGCDFAHFGRPPLRTWRPGTRPRVGFVGGLSWRVDAHLLGELARRRPDWDVHVYGSGGTRLPASSNLVVHGGLPYDELPEVMAALDVGLIPYLDNAFNRASFPLKTFEYLAAGVPVVSSDIPALAPYEPYVRRARSVADFEEAVAASLTPPFTLQDARDLAAKQSWEDRADAFLEHVRMALTHPT